MSTRGLPSSGGFGGLGGWRCLESIRPSSRGSSAAPTQRISGSRVIARPSPNLRLLPEDAVAGPAALELVESYRRLADVFHEVLAELSLDALLVRIADTLTELIPHDTLTIYEADEPQGLLVPVLARDQWADQIMRTTIRFDEGITGWAARTREAALVNQAHLDPRVRFVPGTPIDPEALVCIPLIARSQIKGVLNIYRVGEDASFSDDDFELAKRFGDAAALALDNAQIRARLEHQARTDSLTGLFNHRTFHERLLHALQETSRTHSPVAVLMLDIDDFKRVNDVHGHGVGDELLRLLADTLRAAVRPEDVVCRLGGEEFGVIMSSCDAADATRVAERLVERLARSRVPGGRARHRLDRTRARTGARDEPARARCVRGSGDDDREGARQEPHRPVRGGRARAPRFAAPRARRPLDRAPEAAAEPQREAEPAERRARDRRRDRGRAPLADRLPQLPRVRGRRGRPRADLLPRRVHLGDRGAAARAPAREGRPGHHRARRRARRVAADRRRRQLRVRQPDSGHAGDRGVADRRAAPLRLARGRRDRRLEARARPVRRGRRPPARGARRPRRRRRRERAALRGRAPRGRGRDRAARVRPRARHGVGARGDPLPRRRAVAPGSSARRKPASGSRTRTAGSSRARRTATPRRSRRASRRAGSPPPTRARCTRVSTRSSSRRTRSRRRRATRSSPASRTPSGGSRSRAAPAASSPRSSRRSSASASCGCSAASRTRRSWRSRTRAATRVSSGRSSPPSRRSRTRSRQTTSTRRSTRAGSRISRSASAPSWDSTTRR